jgi:hypothetical protein
MVRSTQLLLEISSLQVLFSLFFMPVTRLLVKLLIMINGTPTFGRANLTNSGSITAETSPRVSIQIPSNPLFQVSWPNPKTIDSVCKTPLATLGSKIPTMLPPWRTLKSYSLREALDLQAPHQHLLLSKWVKRKSKRCLLREEGYSEVLVYSKRLTLRRLRGRLKR